MVCQIGNLRLACGRGGEAGVSLPALITVGGCGVLIVANPADLGIWALPLKAFS
jgi:hypothetical protein